MSANHVRIITERSIVLALIAELAEYAWKPTHCNYGDGVMRFSYKILWDVDTIAVRFTKGGNSHDVILVFGNGEDVVSDWRYSAGDADGFNSLVTLITKQWWKPQGVIATIVRFGLRAQRSIKS